MTADDVRATSDPAAGVPAAGVPATGVPAAGDPAAGDPAPGDPTPGDPAPPVAPAPGGSAPSASPGRRRVGLFAAVAALVLALDLISKLLVVAHLPESHQPVRVLGGVLYLNQARNSGAAFSLGTGFTVVLTLVALVVVALIVRTAGRLRSTAWAVALGLILGGALGNLGDRVFRAPGFGRGHVVDWISLFGSYDRYWPIFNLADSAIVCGAILSALLVVLGVDFAGPERPRV